MHGGFFESKLPFAMSTSTTDLGRTQQLLFAMVQLCCLVVVAAEFLGLPWVHDENDTDPVIVTLGVSS